MLRNVVLEAESKTVTEHWSDEVDFVLDQGEVQRFVNEHRKRALEAEAFDPNRDLREGDVFWLILEERPSLSDSYSRPRGIQSASQFFRPFAEASLWDVTATARLTAKLKYSLVVRPPNERRLASSAFPHPPAGSSRGSGGG
jgi:hypothetical protein